MQNIVYIVSFVLFNAFLGTQADQNNWYSYSRAQFSGKFCLFRDQYQPGLPAEFFNEVTGHACYDYGPKERFFNNTGLKNTSVGKYYPPFNYTYVIAGGIYVKNGEKIIFTFDYKNETVKNFVRESFRRNRYFEKWLMCCKAAEDCCQNEMTNENIKKNEKFCPVVWDGWDCFNSIANNTKVSKYCPSYATMGDPPCRLTSTKECFANATWNQQTDYSPCAYSTIISDRTIFHSYALFVASLLCLPAIILFFIYPSLRITRVILHRNLLIVIIIKNILVIMSKVLITLEALESNGGHIMAANGVPCRILAFFERVAVNAMYACMLVDGYYLHKIIVAVFRKDPPIYLFYLTVAVLSLVPVIIWAGLKSFLDNTNCWVVDESWHHWILDGSRYAMLGINLLLLLDIIRVLIWKLQRNSGSQHTKSTLRATFILLPLFGIQFIMMSQRPVNAVCLWDDVFYYVSYTIDASQGVLVSMLYCYFNKEVQTLIKRSYQKIKTGFNERRPTFNLRRSTTATYVSEKSNAPRESGPKFKGKNLEPIPEEKIPNVKVQSWIQNNFNNS